MAVSDFVKQRYGEKAATRLRQIGTGGNNNQKGSEFESHYVATKVCSIAANESELDSFFISTQEEAFVDDICVRDTNGRCKTNYQAKNSSGDTASWDDDMAERFEMQKEIDEVVHQFPMSKQILLVSDAKRAAANDGKIPEHMRHFCSSEYFVYESKPAKLIWADNRLRQDLSSLCQTNQIDMLSYAFQLVVSAWGLDVSRPRSVGDLIGLANSMGNPEIFATHLPRRKNVPAWLTEKCFSFPGMEPRVEFGTFVVSYYGFEVSLGNDPKEPDAAELEAIADPEDFFGFLMSIAADALSQAAAQKPAG